MSSTKSYRCACGRTAWKKPNVPDEELATLPVDWETVCGSVYACGWCGQGGSTARPEANASNQEILD
jgi:hypothetical protein